MISFSSCHFPSSSNSKSSSIDGTFVASFWEQSINGAHYTVILEKYNLVLEKITDRLESRFRN